MITFKEYAGRLSKMSLTVVSIVLVFLLGIVDYKTGTQFSFTIAYLLPVYLAARYGGRTQGAILSVVSAAACVIADLAGGAHYSYVLAPYWNGGLRLGAFLVVSYYTASLKESNEELQRGTEERTAALLREVGERKLAEVSLRESEDRFRSLSEASFEGIVMTENGVIFDANKRLAEMLGYSTSELVGRNAMEFVAGESLPVVEKHMQSGSDESYEHIAQRKDGSRFPVEVHARMISFHDRKVRITALRDITERKKAEESLKAQQLFLRQVIDLNPGFIFAKDREGRFTLVNRAIAEAYGTTVENLIGKTDADFNPNKDEVDFFRKMDLAVMDALEMRFIPEEKITDASGRLRWLQTVKIPMTGMNGVANQMLGVSTDITERKQSDRLQDAVYRISEAAGSLPTLDDLFRAVHGIISNVMSAKNFYIALHDEETNLLTFPYFVDEVDVRPPAGNVGRGLTAYVLRTGKSLLCDEKLSEELARSGEAELVGAPSPIWLGVPLIVGQRTVGVMVVQDYTNPDVYGERERLILEFVSLEVARAIDRKWAEEKLRESEDRYRRLIELSPDAIIVHVDGMVEFANTASMKLLGASSMNDLIGKPLVEIVHAESMPIVSERIRQMSTTHREVPLIEEKFVRLDGKTIDVEVAAIPFTFRGKFAIQAVVRDITERKRVQSALELQRIYFQQLFENSPAGIVLLDRENKIQNANKAFEQMFQYSFTEARGRNIDDLVVPDTLRPEGEELSNKSQQGNVVQKESLRKRKDGTQLRVTMAGYPIIINEEHVGIYGMYIDVTERVKLEDQLRQAQKMEGIGTLAGGIAHDFNNVLGIILAYISVLQQGKLDADHQAQSLETIEKAVQRGANLVRQLLTFARKSDVSLESLRINDVVTELCNLLKETFQKTITFSLKLGPSIPSVIGDHNQIHQALLNICLNARDAMPRGGTITFTTSLEPLATLLERYPDAREDQYVCLSISDDGEGMDEITRGRIFEPFFTTKERGKGTGLGLAVVYGVVKSHRGYIDVESAAGKGTTFHLYFPAPAQSYDAFKVKKKPLKDVVGGKETILVVEDEEMLLDLVRIVFQAKGYKILTARDGEEGVKVYAEHRGEIALVLSDLGLPKLGGFEEFLEIRKLNKNAKVVFASGYLEPQVRADMLKAGVNDFILKPYEPNEILRKVREILDQK